MRVQASKLIPAPPGPLVDCVTVPLPEPTEGDEIAEIIAEEGPNMNEPATDKILRAFQRGNEKIAVDIRQLETTLRADIKSLEDKVYIDLNGVKAEMRVTDDAVKDLKRDVDDLVEWQTEIKGENRQTTRSFKDSAIRIGMGGLASLLLLGAGVGLAKWSGTPASVVQNQPQGQQDAQNAILTKMDELLEEMRTDRALKEDQPAQTIKVPPRGKQRPAPPAPLVNQYQDRDVIAPYSVPVPAFGFTRIPIPPMERPD